MSKLTETQAKFVLDELIGKGRLTERSTETILREGTARLRARLAEISFGPSRPRRTQKRATVARPRGSGLTAQAHRTRANGKLLLARQRQGRYLGNIRLLNKGQKAKVRAELREKGYPAAIAMAKAMRAES